MGMIERLRAEIIVRQMEVGQRIKRLRIEEREANKERRSVPKSQLAALEQDIRDAQNNLASAYASFEAACKFPPLAR